MVELQRQALSRDNPWPGLDPFDEADRGYFHGRAAESDELLRLVRRELLTVLFGRSGLGKTSLLKAGLFPRLREEDCLPIYLRLDHTEGAPALREQIFRGLQAACEADRIQAARPAEDENLWSFFHRRDAEFWSDRNRPVTPVIVFDQFEEIFTLGQEAEASRARSAAFLAELGDLVENRPPDSIRQGLEAEPTVARRFDFKRSTVKLVLSFREDFLAEMEGLKEQMPSLMYNRFRLLAMSGAQAYDVITRAGGHLVDDDVARRIIRLAWKNEPSPPVDPSDFPKIEIDPALLSVVCSELNHKRQQTKPPLEHITPALLEGADREILSGFYERGMAGLDPRVRAFVEDELITGSGYRDSHAMEDALALPGVTAEALDALIRRRLLRMDDRQSLRRLELTHDVLTRVIKESRDNRRAREAEEAARIREQAAFEQQQSNRRNAALVLAGALVVIVLAGLAGWLWWKASKLRREAESAKLVVNADRLQDTSYDTALLVNLEAVRVAPTLDASAGLLRRFVSHPHLSTFLPGHKAAVYGVAFSRDGKRLASASLDQTVMLWDVANRKLLATLVGHKDRVFGVAFSPKDGKRLASASADGTVILWELDSGRPLATLKGHEDTIYRVAFSPDGKRLASAGEDQTVILWDVASGEPLATLKGHTQSVRDVAFSPDGKQLASASEDETVIVWDVDSRKPRTMLTLKGHTQGVWGVAFSPDGKRLASASMDETVILWDVDNGELLAQLVEHKGPVWGVAFSPDGQQLASASYDKTVILWDVKRDVKTHERLTTLAGHTDEVESVAFSQDGKQLASASYDKTVILWDVHGRKPLTTLKDKHSGRGVAFSPDGKRLASASNDGAVILWDVASLKRLGTLPGHKNEAILSVAFSPDGKRLASASNDDGAVFLWDVASRKRLAMLPGHKYDAILSVAFSPDGKRLASASLDGAVNLWDADSYKLLTTLEHKGYDVAFHPDGKRLASVGKGQTVILWDMTNSKPLAKPLDMPRGVDWITGIVAFSPNGRWLASSAAGGDAVILWDIDSRKQLATLKGEPKSTVLGVAFSPDGKRLASANGDETVILWDVEGRKPLATLEGHTSQVWNVAFSPDGKRLASTSDNEAILWDLDLDSLKAEACRTANRNLTCEEWRRDSYIGAEKPYHKTCEALPGPETCD